MIQTEVQKQLAKEKNQRKREENNKKRKEAKPQVTPTRHDQMVTKLTRTNMRAPSLAMLSGTNHMRRKSHTEKGFTPGDCYDILDAKALTKSLLIMVNTE